MKIKNNIYKNVKFNLKIELLNIYNLFPQKKKKKKLNHKKKK